MFLSVLLFKTFDFLIQRNEYGYNRTAWLLNISRQMICLYAIDLEAIVFRLINQPVYM